MKGLPGPEVVLIKLTGEPGHTDVSTAVKSVVGNGYTVMTVVDVLVVAPSVTVSVTV